MANGVCYVYWIHLPEHTDVFTTGYVGVTSKTVEERFSKHVSDATNNNWRTYTLHNAIRKYGAENLIVSTLIIGDEDYCYLMEAKLRPEKWTAWNVAKGGSSPPSPAGRVHKESSKAKGVQTRRAKYALLSAEEKSERYSKRRGVKLPEEWVQHET